MSGTFCNLTIGIWWIFQFQPGNCAGSWTCRRYINPTVGIWWIFQIPAYNWTLAHPIVPAPRHASALLL